MTQVEIDADGRRVHIRHDGDLTDVVNAAIHAWRSTGEQSTTEQAAEPERVGSIGFSAALEIATPPVDDERITVR